MDDLRRSLLTRNRETFRDLNPKYMLDSLYEQGVIDDEEVKILSNSKQTPQEHARRLYDILLEKNNEAYDKFVKILYDTHKWIAEKLDASSAGISHSIRETEERNYQDALTLGDIPRLPPHYVPRTSTLKDLHDSLNNLKRGQYVVVHGMPGAGKSCLAAAAVSDPNLLRDTFKYRLFWINVGDSKSNTSNIHLLMRLYQKIDYIDSRDKPLSSHSTKSNRHSININDEVEIVRDRLRFEFTREHIRDGLLILDDVTSADVIEAFNFDCKILVTTRDQKVVPRGHSKVIEVKGGFTEQESLALFADCLAIEPKSLPQEAHRIHALCKGWPMLIALIGSLLEQNREDAIRKKDRWSLYCNMLRKGDYQFGDNAQLFKALKMCVENLSPEMQRYYQYFALFVEDVNIMPKVLETIWKKKNYEVEDIMTSLKNKSLVVSIYNHQLGSYIYGIHDLLLAYLKQSIDESRKIQMHRELIASYLDISDKSFANLPNDNYIFSYIGYHLYEGQLWDYFPDVYFNLNFIGAKLKAVGLADLSADFKRYRSLITRHKDPSQSQILNDKLDEYEKFVLDNGQELNKYRNIDVIQCALQQPKYADLSIYNQAFTLAKERSNRLYFQLLFEREIMHRKSTLDLPEAVTAACFTANINRVLVGSENGKINLWDQNYNNLLYTFHGHTDSIVSLTMHPMDREKFLSLSNDGTVKLWSLDGIPMGNQENGCDENGFADKTPSPRTKQANWSNLHDNEEARDRSIVTFRANNGAVLTCAALAHEKNYLLTGADDGTVLVWNVRTRDIHTKIVCDDNVNSRSTSTKMFQPSTSHDNTKPCTPITSCTFSLDDKLVFYSSNNVISICDTDMGNRYSQFTNGLSRTNLLLVIPESWHKIIAISDDAVCLWSWDVEEFENYDLRIDTPQRNVLNSCKAARYTCGAVTVDGTYVVAGASNYTVRMWEIETGNLVREMLDHNGLVICLDTFLQECPTVTHFLLSASNDKTVKQWYIRPIDLEQRPQNTRNKLTELFSAKYCHEQSQPRIAAVDAEDKIWLHESLTKVAEITPTVSCVTTIQYCACGNKVAYGCQSGQVFVHNVKRNKSVEVMRFDSDGGAIRYLEYLSDDILVAGNEMGSLLIRLYDRNLLLNDWTEERRIKNFTKRTNHPLENEWDIELRNNRNSRVIRPGNPVVKCFLMENATKLVVVSQDRIVKCWTLDQSSPSQLENVSIESLPQSLVVDVAMSWQNDSLAFIQDDNTLQVYHISQVDGKTNATYSQRGELRHALTCCVFSPDGKLLAIGQENGEIVLWSLECAKVLYTLQLHRVAIRHLLFGASTFPQILVSVGEQVAWWNISTVQKKTEAGLKRQKRGSGRFSRPSLSFPPVDDNSPLDFNDSLMSLSLNKPTSFATRLWQSKTGGNPEKSELLACIKLRGTYATHIEASKDFTSFSTVDDHGLIYVMNVFQMN